MAERGLLFNSILLQRLLWRLRKKPRQDLSPVWWRDEDCSKNGSSIAELGNSKTSLWQQLLVSENGKLIFQISKQTRVQRFLKSKAAATTDAYFDKYRQIQNKENTEILIQNRLWIWRLVILAIIFLAVLRCMLPCCCCWRANTFCGEILNTKISSQKFISRRSD